MRCTLTRLRVTHTALLLFSYPALGLGQASGQLGRFPAPEKLTYLVEWRLITAGTATVQLNRDTNSKGWNFNVNIESAGLVSRLYRVLDSYKVATTDHFCVTNSVLDAQEGKKHTISKMSVESTHHKLNFEERDLVRNTTQNKQLEIAPCTYEITGALAAFRTLSLEPGRSTEFPITDGKKFAQARLVAEAKEKITVNNKSYSTTRYEALLFDNVLYKRHGRLLLWISDDADHLPVQFRLLMGFPVGTVTISLQKQER